MTLRSGRKMGETNVGKSNENSPKIKLEMQEMCSTCEELRKSNELLTNKCRIYEQQIESFEKIKAEMWSFLQESGQKIAKLSEVVGPLTQQIAENITENSILGLESDANIGGNVKDNICQHGGSNLPDIDKFLEIKMEIPNEDDSREKENGKEQDVEINSEMENSENSVDINQVFEEAEDEETEESSNEKQEKTCTWIVHDDKGTSGCCGRVFPSPEDLASHFNKDHLNSDGSGIYVCLWDGCKRNGEPFKGRTNIINHFRTHSGERPFRCVVEGCGWAFKDARTLSLHRNRHFKTTFPCLYPGCPKVFSREQTMKSHYRVMHEGEKRFKCPAADCGKVFETQWKLGIHCRTHTGRGPSGGALPKVVRSCSQTAKR